MDNYTFTAAEEAEVLGQLNQLGISFTPNKRALRLHVQRRLGASVVCVGVEEVERLERRGRRADR